MKREIESLEAKQPETENLIILGKNFDCSEIETLTRVPVITITPDESKRNPLRDPDDRAALKIVDREFVLESARHFEKLTQEETQLLQLSNEDTNGKKYVYSPFDSDCLYEILPKRCKPITWALNFLAKDDELCERIFCIENRGVRVVHVEWREATPNFLPISLPERVESRFFFNKSRVSILPGQKIEIPVWFRADQPIVTTETWKLVVDPKIYPGTLLLRLWATSFGENYKLQQERQVTSMKALLERRVQKSTIRQIIDDLILTATTESSEDDVPYEMYFLESELFQARNPGYYYKSTLIGELKQMHENITDEQDSWNLLLDNLRSILMKLQDPIVRREKFLRFQMICQECLIPDLYYNRPRPSKQRLVYLLFCMFFNRFEDEDTYVMRCCCRENIMDDENEEELARGIPETDDTESEVFITGRNLEIYREAMYIRIYCLLRDTIDRVCVIIDSCEFFNK